MSNARKTTGPETTSPEAASGQRGMILVNVLIIVMLTTAVLAIMLAGEDGDVERTVQLRAAAQAMATARGGELSAITALRRDLASGSDTDSVDEAWAKISDRNARIEGGRFTFAVTDAQARFNINTLVDGNSLARTTFGEIAAAAGVPASSVDTIATLLQVGGPIDDLTALRATGLDDTMLRNLAQLCTALPEPTQVNLNTAPEALMAILLGNPSTARSIMTLRANSGGLTRERLVAGSVVLPAGVVLNSDYFWARGKVTIGDTRQQLTSLLHRTRKDGVPSVVVLRRWRGGPPMIAPTLPVVTSPES